jgi:GTPase
MNDRQKRCAVVGVVGRTNSGKSTLINRIVGEKVSIVSPVVQTTRNTVRAVLTRDDLQLVFLDTPGLHKAESALGTLMNRMARSSSAGADILAVVFDASHRVHQEDEGWMSKALKLGTPLVFVLNKADNAGFNPRPFHECWQRLIEPLPEAVPTRWIECSAVRRGGADALIEALAALAQPADDFLFPEDIVTDYPRKLAIADTVREKFLPRLRDEIPHELGVFVENIQETPSAWDISATVYVSRPSQKGIVIGPKGALLKEVRQKAERELSDIYGVRIRMELWVKVEKNWFQNHKFLEQMGYAGRL